MCLFFMVSYLFVGGLWGVRDFGGVCWNCLWNLVTVKNMYKVKLNGDGNWVQVLVCRDWLLFLVVLGLILWVLGLEINVFGGLKKLFTVFCTKIKASLTLFWFYFILVIINAILSQKTINK